jgi:hypothetical protein
MKIGIISDTHNNIEGTIKACDLFKMREVDIVVHAGDFTSPKIINFFADFNCKFVLGNADIDIDLLNTKCKNYGFAPIEEVCEFNGSGKNFLVIHGNIVSIFREAVASGKYDYIIKGHTHYFENYIRNNTRVMNPGSLYGSDEHSIAILDIDKDEVEKVIIDI